MPKKTGTKKSQTNDNQQKAIKHKFGPLLVIAGAGTGKTRVITERIKHLIEKGGVSPNQILALTFTEKASQEMLNRIGDVMPLGYEEPWVYTFHSFTDRILKEEGLEIGLDPSFKIIPDPEQWLLLRKNIFNLNLSYFRTLGNPTKFISAILKFISRLQDENISPKEFALYVKLHKFEGGEKNRWEELSYIYQQYTQLKIQDSKMDFGDLITWAIKLFKDRPHVLKRYQEQFEHILVDEFQDTNYAQYELIKLLCPAKMKNRSLLVVGDDSQSIYKFRGAAVSNIIQFMEDYPNAEMVTLIQNYRSTQKILDPAYKLIQNNNPDTLESKLGISKKLEAEKSKKGPTPKVIFLDSLENEVEYVISIILDILGKEPEYTYKDFAVLARANNHLDPFVMTLRKYGLPYQLVGNKGLYDRAEVVDLSSIIKTIINPKDGPSLFMSLNIQTLNIPYNEIIKVFSTSRFERTDVWEVLKNNSNANIKAFIEIVENFQKNITRESPSRFVYNLVAATNFLNQFLDKDTIENQLCIKNLNLFLRKVQKFEVDFYNESKRMPTIIDLVDYLDLMREAGENPAQAEIEDIDTINLMTVHASKGLEFPIVFMVNLVSDRFPTRNRGDEIEVPDDLIKEMLPTGDEHIQEERRLFYVGMTRAKKYLYLTSAKNYGGKRDKTPSGFLGETGIESVEVLPKDITTKKLQGSLFDIETDFRDPAAQKIGTLIPTTLSYSQVEKFRVCPLQYKYAYILRIPTPPNHSLSFGDTIHKTLRDFHYNKMFNNKVGLQELFSIYEKNWQPTGYLSEEHRKLRFDSGKKLLEEYFKKHSGEKVRHLGLEKTFNLNFAGTKFTGKIDRIDELASGGVEIVDYKTGSSKDQKAVDKDGQVTIYAIAAKRALGLDPKLLSLYFVEAGQKISTTRTEEQFNKTEEEVAEVVVEMKKGKFGATPGAHCAFCDYKNICPFSYKS
jgi:DNA helicase-2/ATP-dependent DNA helicase PcrA